MSILSRLLKKKVITKEQASKLQAEAKSSAVAPEELALKQNITDEDTLYAAKAEELKVPLKSAGEDAIPSKVLELIPEDSAKYYRMVPLQFSGQKLEVGMVNPDDIQAQQALKFLARQGKFSYTISLITPSTFEKLFASYRDTKKETGKVLEELEEEIKTEKVEISKDGTTQRGV